jgi:hypothetical protein
MYIILKRYIGILKEYLGKMRWKPSSQEWRERAQQEKGGILDKARRDAVDDVGDTTNRRRRRRLITQFAVLHRLGRGLMGRAQQQFALLRGCLFPKRDVIEWVGT